MKSLELKVNKLLFDKLIIIWIVLISTIFPTIDFISISGTAFKTYWISVVLCFLVVISGEVKLKIPSVFWLWAVFILYSICIFGGYDPDLIAFANQQIPANWFEMNHVSVDSYYRPIIISLFQILNFIFFAFLFLYFSNVNYTQDFKAFLLNILLISLCFQLLISIMQVTILSESRAFGTLDNPQALALFSTLVLCIYISQNRFSRMVAVAVALSIICIALTGTRSSMLVALVIISFNYLGFKRRKSYILALIIINLLLTVLIPFYPFLVEGVLLEVSAYTNTFSLYLRYILWESFASVLSVSSLFGVMGTTVHFSENIFWFFLISYGVVGLSIFLLMIKSLLTISNKSVYFLLLVMLIQGFTYYGVMIGITGILFWTFVGVEYARKNHME